MEKTFAKKRFSAAVEVGKRHGLDWILCSMPENIFYFSGFRTTFYTRFIGVLIPISRGSEPVLVVSSIDKVMVQKKIWSPPWTDQIMFWGPAGCEYVTQWDALSVHLRAGDSIGVDALPFDFYTRLNELFANLKVKSLQEEILLLRMIKDETEIDAVKRATALTENVLSLVPDWLQAPITEAELAAELNYSAMKLGAEGIFYPTLVSCGEKMLAVHSPPLDRPIEANKLIRIAFALQVDGYGSDIVRTFCKGRPPEEIIPLKNAFFEAQQSVFDMLRPGVTSEDLLKKVETTYREKGCLANWSYNIGHGIALTIHEPPRIAGNDKTLFRENMIVAVEPGLRCLPHGSFAHCDLVRITSHGCELLSHKMRDLVVV